MPVYLSDTLPYSKESVLVFVRRIEFSEPSFEPLDDEMVCDLCMALVTKMDAAEFELADSKGKLRVRAVKKLTSRSFFISKSLFFWSRNFFHHLPLS
jgi:hypothetical protein